MQTANIEKIPVFKITDSGLLTWSDPAVQRVNFVPCLVSITAVITRIISCYYRWHLISLI